MTHLLVIEPRHACTGKVMSLHTTWYYETTPPHIAHVASKGAMYIFRHAIVRACSQVANLPGSNNSSMFLVSDHTSSTHLNASPGFADNAASRTRIRQFLEANWVWKRRCNYPVCFFSPAGIRLNLLDSILTPSEELDEELEV